MRELLVVSPHFPPINAADHQRVRMALPFFADFGWKPTVLSVGAERVEGVRDPFLEQVLPRGLEVIRADALSVRMTRLFGVDGLAYRAGRSLRCAGDALLTRKTFNVTFFSTTVFPVMRFGPRWRKEFNVPYVLDFQDPWLSDYYLEHPEQRPPGGRLKYGLARWLAKRQEPPAVYGAAHIVSVSYDYAKMLQRRYRDLPDDRFTTLPFAAAESDFAALPELDVKQSLFDPKDGRTHWVYVGRGGADMAFSVRAFCAALRRFLEVKPEWRTKLRVHFAGTDYATRRLASKTIEPLARESGVDDIVSEQTDRLPYFEVLRCLTEAHGLIIPGSDDPGYTASKLYPYILAKKPLLAVFHEQSSVVDILRLTGAGKVVTFRSGSDLQTVADEITRQWFDLWPMSAPRTDWAAFAPYTAKEMTRKLCEVFDRVVLAGNR